MGASNDNSVHGLSTYLTGFMLALILTAVPFGLVISQSLARTPTLIAIGIAAVLQVLVHLRFFLHMNLKTTPRENIVALAFAATLILVMVGGTLWIMFNLHHRMMV